MAKMSEDDLLSFLEAEQAEAFQYNDGDVARARNQAMRDYLRFPYGTEQEGRSQVVTSDVFDTVEGILPDLVEVFVSSDKAVVFDPVGPEDEQGAKQATDACNHVFYKQNNGFLILYTAAKDALMLRTGGVKWFWDVRRTPKFETFSGDEMQIAAHLASNPKAQVIGQEELEPEPEMLAQYQAYQQQALAMGAVPEQIPPMPVRYKVRLKTIEEKGQVRVVPIPAYELEVSARHNSILLDDCPYVAHKSLKTLSDIQQMGFDVTEDDVKAARDENPTQDREFYDTVRGEDIARESNDLDPAMVRGWIREEYVLCDFDGDGVAERRKVIRLGRKVLENEEFSHVPMAAWTPYILTHKFDGLSVDDLVGDIQRITTDIMRAQLDNLQLANNQETVVLTDTNGNPKANIDDLLNRRPGGVIREQHAGAVRPYAERWQGIEAMPMVEMVSQIKEKRTGYSPVVAGLDADALNKTATEVSKQTNERQKRMKLMARIMAECLVKPMFRGILKTLTDYCMEKLAFRLNGTFVQYDPQEWTDGYDMTINVGIGTGDTMQQTMFLQAIANAQAGIAQSPFGQMLIDAEKIYNVQARLAELAGFKNPNDFWNAPPKDPQTGKVAQPQSGPPPQIILEQIKGQTQMQLQQAKNDLALNQKRAELELQAANDMRDYQREQEKAAMDMRIRQMEAFMEQQAQQQQLMFQQWKAELDAAVKLKQSAMQAQATADAATQAAEAEITREVQ